jgi:hypothetical protein
MYVNQTWEELTNSTLSTLITTFSTTMTATTTTATTTTMTTRVSPTKKPPSFIPIEITNSTISMTTLTLIDQAQLNNDLSTIKMISLNRTRTRLSGLPTEKKSTGTRFQSIQSRLNSTEPMKINYVDRSTLDLCQGFYDAITMYKGILFIFKGQVSFCFS